MVRLSPTSVTHKVHESDAGGQRPRSDGQRCTILDVSAAFRKSESNAAKLDPTFCESKLENVKV